MRGVRALGGVGKATGPAPTRSLPAVNAASGGSGIASTAFGWVAYRMRQPHRVAPWAAGFARSDRVRLRFLDGHSQDTYQETPGAGQNLARQRRHRSGAP